MRHATRNAGLAGAEDHGGGRRWPAVAAVFVAAAGLAAIAAPAGASAAPAAAPANSFAQTNLIANKASFKPKLVDKNLVNAWGLAAGLVGYRLADGHARGTMVAVGCETEPVSKNDDFQAFGKKVLDLVEAAGIDAVSELEQERVELSGKLGENIALAGAARFEAVDGGRINAYVHPPANKLGVLVHLHGGDDELARNLAMHISWSDPRWVGREDVPDDLVAAEREIYLNSDEVQSKPEQAREKIVTGMLDKRFFAERGGVLADQPWIHDGSQAVGKVLADAGAEVLEFQRFSLAG